MELDERGSKISDVDTAGAGNVGPFAQLGSETVLVAIGVIIKVKVAVAVVVTTMIGLVGSATFWTDCSEKEEVRTKGAMFGVRRGSVGKVTVFWLDGDGLSSSMGRTGSVAPFIAALAASGKILVLVNMALVGGSVAVSWA